MQYDQELSNLCYKGDRLQASLAIYDSGSEASSKASHVVYERLEAYIRASEWLHFPLESDLSHNLGKVIMKSQVY